MAETRRFIAHAIACQAHAYRLVAEVCYGASRACERLRMVLLRWHGSLAAGVDAPMNGTWLGIVRCSLTLHLIAYGCTALFRGASALYASRVRLNACRRAAMQRETDLLNRAGAVYDGQP